MKKCGFLECSNDFDSKRKDQNFCSRDCRRKFENKKYYHKHKNNKKIRWKTNYKNHKENIKKKLLKIYGNQCSCCGINIYEFLTLEHKNGGGGEHRKKLGGSLPVWKEAIKSVDFEKYEILCMNCNWGKRFLHNCPCSKRQNFEYEDHYRE